jgi:3-oxoacid CoA-transferase
MTVMSGGFGLCGIPENLILALRDSGCTPHGDFQQRGRRRLRTWAAAGDPADRKMVSSYVGENQRVRAAVSRKGARARIQPAGHLAERIRAGGAGIYGFYTRTGAGTVVAEGKETRVVDGDTYVLETGLTADLSIVKAWKGDTEGNLVYRKTARNFNPMMATAGQVTVAEVEQLVEPGTLDPDQVHTPGIFVQRIFQGSRIKRRSSSARSQEECRLMPWTREDLARRAAPELRDGYYVNLGIGIPTLVANYIPAGHERRAAVGERHARHGPFPYEGEEDPDLINAGKQTITELADLVVFLVVGQLRHDPRRSHQPLRARRARSRRKRRPRQLDGAGQDGQGHGRCHGPGRRRAPRRGGHGAQQQGWLAEVQATLRAAAYRRQLCRHAHHGPGGYSSGQIASRHSNYSNWRRG